MMIEQNSQPKHVG